jgi:hypothetical protein
MNVARASSARPQPVERFKPTSGQVLGYVGLACAVFALGYVAWTVHNLTGLRIGLGAVLFGAVVWVTQLRPRATAYPHHVLLKNAVRDAHVPLAAVDEVSIGQTLSLWVGESRYTCIGIGNSIRNDVKSRRRAALDEADIGTSRFSELRRKADLAGLDERAMSYQTFVVTRLEELVDQAKREHARTDQQPGRARWTTAWPELAVLVLSGVAFVVSLFL